MARTYSITAKVAVVDASADGSQCPVCGDSIFLWAKTVEITINGGNPNRMERILCKSCGDALAEEMNGGYGE